jgi:hypothetical protein
MTIPERVLRTLLGVVLIVAGLATIIGSGGGGSGGGAAEIPDAAPTITTQPASVSVTAPATATFNVVASGVPEPTYRWQLSTDGGATFSDISGATSASYTTAATSGADSGRRYRVVVSNAAGSVTSDAVMLTVVAPTPTPPNGGRACANVETMPAGVLIQSELGSPASTIFRPSVTLKVNGPVTFQGYPTTEVELTTTGLIPATIVAKVYSTYELATGAVTRYGGDASVAYDASNHSESTNFYSPPAIDLQHTLAPGGTVAQSQTVVQTDIVTTNGVTAPAATRTTTTVTTITLVGIEQVTVPAGTFTACKFQKSVQGETGTTTDWNHAATGINVKSISRTGYVLEALSILVNGSPLQ